MRTYDYDFFISSIALCDLHGLPLQFMLPARQTAWRWSKTEVPLIYLYASAVSLLLAGVSYERLQDMLSEFPLDHPLISIVQNCLSDGMAES